MIEIKIDIEDDSYNTYVTDKLHVLLYKDDTIGLKISNNDRIISIKKDELLKVLKLIELDINTIL